MFDRTWKKIMNFEQATTQILFLSVIQTGALQTRCLQHWALIHYIHPSFTFFLSFQNLEFEYIKEDVGYGTIDLLCDVGGTLSLLMGASLLTCCELLEVAWIVMAKKCCRKVGKTLAAPSRRRAKRPFQSQDQRGSTAGLGGLEGAGNDSTSAVASNTTKLQTKV